MADGREVRKVDYKESLKRSEEFAKKVINLAVEEGLTIGELHKAADIAKEVSGNSLVDYGSIEKTNFYFPIIAAYDGKEPFNL